MARKQVINTFNININTNTNISHLNLFIVDCVLVAAKQVINCHHTLPLTFGICGTGWGEAIAFAITFRLCFGKTDYASLQLWFMILMMTQGQTWTGAHGKSKTIVSSVIVVHCDIGNGCAVHWRVYMHIYIYANCESQFVFLWKSMCDFQGLQQNVHCTCMYHEPTYIEHTLL